MYVSPIYKNAYNMKNLIEERFPGMTIGEICDWAELGTSVKSMSDDGNLVPNLLFLSVEIMRSDSDLANRTRYCLSDLIELIRYLCEFEKK